MKEEKMDAVEGDAVDNDIAERDTAENDAVEELQVSRISETDIDKDDSLTEDALSEDESDLFIPTIDLTDIKVSKFDRNNKIHVLDGTKKILLTPEFYFCTLIMYLELIFHFSRFGFTFDNVFYKLFFALFFGFLCGAFVGLFPKIFSIIFSFLISIFLTVFFLVQIVFSGVFGTYLSLSGSIGVANQALDFTDVIFKELREEWYIILLIIAPLVCFLVFLRKLINFEKRKIYVHFISFGATVLIIFLIMIRMQLDRKKIYSAYEVYKNYTSVDMSVEKLGVMESFYLDAKLGIKEKMGINNDKVSFIAESDIDKYETTGANDIVSNGGRSDSDKSEGNSVTDDNSYGNNDSQNSDNGTDDEQKSGKNDSEDEAVIDTSPNVLDIDFDELMEAAPNENIRAMHEYISRVKPTNKNEYTGMFEGYNLIFFVAEGFSGLCIDEKRTPMLYKMKYEGFYFDNYYTPLWYGSTLGGEYADLTGLMPKNGGYLSMSKSGQNKNDMMFTLSRQLLKKGYKVTGYHNNYYDYYDRNISHPNLGYDWIGVGNGYEPEYGAGGNMLWPQSDERMIETTFDEYAGDQPFHTYYLTVSGHVMYNFGGNAMAKKHMDLVEDLDYSETTKAYIACQYELELALEKLVAELERKGIADKTLIVLTADHVPYDNKEVEDELAGHTLDNTFEWYENTLIIWSASMEKPVYVEKCCSSLDILPTVSNLMGLEYDSRMLVGQDILSDSEGLVMFNDRSFITDKISYNENTGEVKSLDGKPIDEDYVEAKVVQVRNKFSMAEKICDYDYYKYIDDYINKEGKSR